MAKAKVKTKRARIDWEAAERDFRTGKFSQVEIAAKHKTAEATLCRRMKADQKANPSRWQRDLTEAVRQATNAALMTEMVNSEVKTGQEQVNSAIQATAELNKQVILGHRKDAKEARAAMEKALGVVIKCGASLTDIREAAIFASAVESLSRTAKNTSEMERKAFRLDDEKPPAAGPSEFVVRYVEAEHGPEH